MWYDQSERGTEDKSSAESGFLLGNVATKIEDEAVVVVVVVVDDDDDDDERELL